MNYTTPAIADLKSKWYTLNDLDRARAVSTIKRSGTSTREIAFHLNCSESLLRHLLTALQAPQDDRDLALCGEISTNELARRARATGARHIAKNGEAREFERAQTEFQEYTAICAWLQSERMSRSDCKKIINEARRQLATSKLTRKLPGVLPPPDMPTDGIIQWRRPSESVLNELPSIALLGLWLAVWINSSIADPWVRLQTIELAFNDQFQSIEPTSVHRMEV
jgi:hypothetical protein